MVLSVFNLELCYQNYLNGKLDLKKIGYDGEWIEMVQDRTHCQDWI
jgi:hypothetical protein